MTSTPLFFLTLLLLPSFFFPSLPLQKNSQEKGLKNTPKQEESPEEKAQRELEERRKRYQEQQKKDQELRKQEEERRRKNLEFLRQREAQEGKNSIIVPYTLDEAPFEWIQKALPDLLPKLEQTLKAGFKPNQRNSFDYSLLNYAIFCNSHEDPQALCEIRGNRYDEILLLLHYGADPQLQDSQHGNALHMAAKKGDINLTYLFLEKGVSVHSLNARQETPRFPYCSLWSRSLKYFITPRR
jgi:ankyrin repeat protein